MLLKRMILKVATITLMSLSAVAFAAPDFLHTENFTDKDSTVYVTSSIKPTCAGNLGNYTPKRNADGTPGTSDVKWFNVKALCFGSKDGKCKADIYMSKDCSGSVVAKSELDLSTGDVTIVSGTVDPGYDITAKGPSVRIALAGGK